MLELHGRRSFVNLLPARPAAFKEMLDNIRFRNYAARRELFGGWRESRGKWAAKHEMEAVDRLAEKRAPEGGTKHWKPSRGRRTLIG